MSESNQTTPHWCKSVVENAVPSSSSYVSWPSNAPPMNGIHTSINNYGNVMYPHQSMPSMYGYGLQTSNNMSIYPSIQASSATTANSISTVMPSYHNAFGIGPNSFSNFPQASSVSAPGYLPYFNPSLSPSSLQMPPQQSSLIPPQSQPQTRVDTQITHAGKAQIIYHMPHTNTGLSSTAMKKSNTNRFASSTTPTTIATTTDAVAATTPVLYPSSPSVNTIISDSLKTFKNRSLAACTSSQETIQMNSKIDEIVARLGNKIYSHQWELEPIPTISNDSAIKSEPPSQSSQSNQAVANKANEMPSIDSKKRKSRWDPDDSGNVSLSLSSSRPEEQSNALSSKSQKIVHMNPMTNLENSLKLNKYKSNVLNITPAKITAIDQGPITPEDLALREQRASRFQINTTTTTTTSIPKPLTTSSKVKSKNKTYRAGLANSASSQSAWTSDNQTEINYESLKIVGTSQTLEKDYFRLTSAPEPSSVRPAAVLKKALQLIKSKWKSGDVEYIYICSQLKAVRQDLTVQDIRNELMIDVYETHARIALECGDLNEYNQCQTQLKQLYDSGLPGATHEFTAYRILYYVYLQNNKKYQKGSSDLTGILASLSVDAKSNPAVKHALRVRQAVQRENYHIFFRLYRETPNMGAYILDHMLDSLRVQVLSRMCKAYKSHIPLAWVIEELGFDSERVTIAEEFLLRVGCVFIDLRVHGDSSDELGRVIDTSQSKINPAATQTQQKLLL